MCSCRHRCNHSNYGCMMFLLDLFMLVITSGLWIIWIIYRQARR